MKHLPFLFLAGLLALSLPACGVKPAHVDPPQGEQNDAFPRSYPNPAYDPAPQPTPNPERLIR